MIKQELTYWVTLALIPKIWTKRKNDIYVDCFMRNPQISIIELFEKPNIWDELGLTEEEKELFLKAKVQLANISFLVEELLAQGYDILPITHKEYPGILKSNLKRNAPIVIYVKGNKQLLQEPAVAVVGSRRANDISLSFTDNIVRQAVANNKVIVSGFAKGVDRQALDSALEYNGKSIIILPQGITTFSSGFKQYYKQITQGKVLVMSIFAPKAPWSVEFAMARNPIIYGMASDIYVAQSEEKGGTWSGVMDGLRKNRTIYVRHPEKDEKNANLLLIQKGASAVDMNGNVLKHSSEEINVPLQQTEDIDTNIMALLKRVGKISAKNIIIRLQIDWNEDKLKRHLFKMPQVEKVKERNRVFYQLKGMERELYKCLYN